MFDRLCVTLSLSFADPSSTIQRMWSATDKMLNINKAKVLVFILCQGAVAKALTLSKSQETQYHSRKY